VAIKDTVYQSVEDIDRTITLNLNSAIYGAKAFGDIMKEKRGGTIINLSSVCAKEAWQGWTVYAASKWGVLGFSKGLYVEMRPYNVRVTCVIPAAASTGFQRNAGIGEVDNLLTPNDIAQTILYVCSLPAHAVVEEVTVCGIDQEVNPL
jgi:NADP-dependent 3-hydroxy acid dehydrogenase YdfG